MMTATENHAHEDKKRTCFADYVVDVPKVILNHKKFTKYDCLQFLGSVSTQLRHQNAKKKS